MLRFFKRAPREDAGRETRAEPRTPSKIAAMIDWGSSQVPCTVVDVATGGARVHLDADASSRYLCFGQQVVVTPVAGVPIAGVLRWREGAHIGVRFLTPLSLESLETMVASSSRPLQPRPTRIRVGRRAIVIVGSENCAVSLVNISSGGALICGAREMEVGMSLFLHFSSLRPIGAYVRRRAGQDTGLLFSRLLPVDAARHIAALCDVDPHWVAEVAQHHAATGHSRAS